jgi:hypothetical protein
MAYASTTGVPIERTRMQIERELVKFGAEEFLSGVSADKAFVGFKARNRYVRFMLPLPNRNDKQFRYRTTGRQRYGSRAQRSDAETLKRWEQACRSRWRALLLTLKAKLESIESGIETFEQAFMAHIQLPDQTLVGDRVVSAIDDAYQSGYVRQLPPVASPDAEDIE